FARVAQSSNHLALLAEHQQAAHVRLQWQQLGMTSEVSLQGRDPGRILRPAGGLAQHVLDAGGIDGRRLSGCLVHQQGHGRRFDCTGTGQQLDTLRLDLEIRGFDSLPVDLDPAAFDIELGLTPGAAHLLGKAFGQAGRFGHVNSGGGKSERAAAEKRTLQLAERGWNYFLLMVIWRDGPCVCPLTPLGIFWISPPAFRNAAICAARDWLVSLAGSGLRLADEVLLAIVLSFPLVNRTGHYTDFVGERSIIRSAAHAASAFGGVRGQCYPCGTPGHGLHSKVRRGELPRLDRWRIAHAEPLPARYAWGRCVVRVIDG